MEATRGYHRRELHATLHFGASCRRNTGHGSIAFVIFNDDDGTVLQNFNACLNICLRISSEIAGYKALIAGLRHARRLRIRHITVVGQCRLVKEYEQGARTGHSSWFERIYYSFQKLSAEFENINLRDVHYNDNTAVHSLIRKGFSNTFVDRSIRARDEILLKYRDPRSARKYVLEESCEGYYKTKFILDTIQNNLPESYAAIRRMCDVINQESGEWCDLRSNRVMASFLAIY
eukprot:PITA_19859